jgi:predicted GH43/DUF377 family glycosyl hydrolase
VDPKYRPTLEKVRTPCKYPELVVKPSFKKGEFDSHFVDGPFVFEHEERFYMTYIGWDTVGYRTGLASSDDLVHWTKEGLLIDRGPKGSPTEFNVAMTWIARSNDLFGECRLKKVDGQYVGTYHAYPEPGNEQGSAAIGLCWSEDLRHWDLDDPFLFSQDGAPWERGGLYKSCLLEHEGTWYLFYNAKNELHWPWREQMGAVVSTDLRNWRRLEENPLVKVGPPGSFEDLFASEPCVYKVGDVWALFYFGNSSDGHARDSVAFSEDLIHWEKSREIIVDVGPEGSIDSRHAHKPAMFFKDARLYHYYTAAADHPGRTLGEIEHGEIRGIGLAVSEI